MEAFLFYGIALPGLLSSLGFLLKKKYGLAAMMGCFFVFALILMNQYRQN